MCLYRWITACKWNNLAGCVALASNCRIRAPLIFIGLSLSISLQQADVELSERFSSLPALVHSAIAYPPEKANRALLVKLRG